MIRITKDNAIEMTRGDTLLVHVALAVDGEPYEPAEGDSIRFAVKHDRMDIKRTSFVDASPLVIKDIPTDTLLLRLDPEDTKALAFGDYVYDIQLTRSNGFVNTFIADSRLTLLREVD